MNNDDWRIPDELWWEMERLLPARKKHPLGCHNPRVPDRAAMDAILFVLRTGCRWAVLNVGGICSRPSAHRRFVEWKKAGVFEQFRINGLFRHEKLRGIDLSRLAADQTMTAVALKKKK